MPTFRVWSDGRNEWTELDITDGQHAAIDRFLNEHLDGSFFSSNELHELLTEDQNEALNTGTASLATAFLQPDLGFDGFGITQHGHDDFTIDEEGTDQDEETPIPDNSLRFVDSDDREIDVEITPEQRKAFRTFIDSHIGSPGFQDEDVKALLTEELRETLEDVCGQELLRPFLEKGEYTSFNGPPPRIEISRIR